MSNPSAPPIRGSASTFRHRAGRGHIHWASLAASVHSSKTMSGGAGRRCRTTAAWATGSVTGGPPSLPAAGPAPPRGAVVDARGRVYGIEHLHVADASIMPAIPSANTNLPTIMIAERVASWITAERHGP